MKKRSPFAKYSLGVRSAAWGVGMWGCAGWNEKKKMLSKHITTTESDSGSWNADFLFYKTPSFPLRTSSQPNFALTVSPSTLIKIRQSQFLFNCAILEFNDSFGLRLIRFRYDYCLLIRYDSFVLGCPKNSKVLFLVCVDFINFCCGLSISRIF